MKFEKIQKLNVAQTVFEQLRQMIIEGEWGSGQRIPSENDMADRLGVSRSTIRQAIQKLDALGLVTTRVGEGTYINELSIGTYMKQIMPVACLENDNIRQVMQYRLIVEPECAALAAKNADEKGVSELQSCYENMTKPGIDYDSCVEHDFAFHNQLVRMADNSVLLQVQLILQDVLKRTITELTTEFTNDSGIKYHKLIIAAVGANDQDAARGYMREHMQDMLSKYEQKYETQR